jgi:hypothetical protein
MKIRIIKHEAVPECGSYEVRFPDGGVTRLERTREMIEEKRPRSWAPGP